MSSLPERGGGNGEKMGREGVGREEDQDQGEQDG